MLMTLSISWPGFMSKWFLVEKIHSKMFSALVNALPDVKTFEVDSVGLKYRRLNISKTEQDLSMN